MASVSRVSSDYTPLDRQSGSVLVVDDDEIARSHLAVSLEGRGYTVSTAGSGIQALLALQARRFDVVIADWLMPGIDGPALCRHIRNRPGEHYPYVLLFSIRSEIADVVTALRAGADDYIVKGTPMAQIVARLESGRRMVALRAGTLPVLASTPVQPQVSPPATADLALSLAGAYADCRQRHAPISLLLCAPDNVRELHERLGFETTAALMAAAHGEVAKCLLRSEWLASCGRDGFLVVLPDTLLNGACLVAEKIRDALRGAAANLAVSAASMRARLSIGIAAIEDGRQLPHFKPLDLLRAAEQCLGQSRGRGGDQTSWAHLHAHG